MKNRSFPKIFEFYLKQLRRRPRGFSHAPALFSPAEVFTLGQLEGHLNNPMLSPEWVQVVEKGKIVDLGPSYLNKSVQGRELKFMDKSLLSQSLQRGAALVLEGLDILDQRLNAFTAELDAALPCALSNCEAFYSQRNNEAYYGHRDSDDVLVLQLEGKKIWHLYAPQQRRYFNNAPLSEEQMGKKLVALELHPGDALYVRAGVPHRCQTPGDYSLHLSFDLIDKTPNVEQLAREANERYFNASEEPYVSPKKMLTRYTSIYRDRQFQKRVAELASRAKNRSHLFRAAMGRSAGLRLKGGQGA